MLIQRADTRIPSYPRFAWVLWTSVLGLIVIGVLAIYSAKNGEPDQMRAATFHGAFALTGLCIAGLMGLIDYDIPARGAAIFYGFALGLLVLVLAIGVERFGAQRWLPLGPIQFQPSEVAKLAYIFMLAAYLSGPKVNLNSLKTLLVSLTLLIVPVGLILLEPDLGSSMVFFPVGLVMMYVGGIPKRYLAWVTGGSIFAILVVLLQVLYVSDSWRFIELQPYQKDRLLTYFNIDFASMEETEEAKREARRRQSDLSYNVRQALISVGSGGLTGKGWLQSEQVALNYLPKTVAHNDFIFSVVAEENGFLGSALVIALYACLMWSGLFIANQARDTLGKLLATGIVTLWLSQVFINIGMNIGLTPVTGLPLPLLSYGGTATISALISIGILQNVYMYRKHI